MARYEIWVNVPVPQTVDEERKGQPGKFKRVRKAIPSPRYWKDCANQHEGAAPNKARTEEAYLLQVKHGGQQFYVRDRQTGAAQAEGMDAVTDRGKGVH